MIGGVAEIGSVGAFAVLSMVRAAGVPLPEPVYQFGALGLVAFMVIQNYRQAATSARLVTERDTRFDDLTGKLAALAERESVAIEHVSNLAARLACMTAEETTALEHLAEALKERPCLAGEARVAALKRLAKKPS